MGHVHKIAVEVKSRSELGEALQAGPDILVLGELSSVDAREFIDQIRAQSSDVIVEISGAVTLDNVRSYAEAGADLIGVAALTQSVKAMDIMFQIQQG